MSRPRLAPSSESYTLVLLIHTHTDIVLNARKNIWRVSEHNIHTFTLIHVYYACHQIHTCSTLLDVVSDDAYMLITVRTCVFMPEPDHVAKFMYHNAKLVTVLSDRDGLRAATSPSHVGTTPAGGNTSDPHPGVSRTRTDSLLLASIKSCTSVFASLISH